MVEDVFGDTPVHVVLEYVSPSGSYKDRGASVLISKVKETLIENSTPFQKRHLPPYLEELLTLISFPSRLIEEITKTRLEYARRVKETAQQNPLMQDQMISQFQLLLKFAIMI